MALRHLLPGLWLGFAGAAFAVDSPERLEGVATAVIDGNTVKVHLVSGPTLVRLAHVYAPEFKQPGGREARDALHQRIVGANVTLEIVTLDEQRRPVVVIHDGDENINAWMVKQGHAWAYRGHTRDVTYCVWENAARSLRRGLWAQKEWIAPWEWRDLQKDGKGIVSDYRNVNTATCIAELGRVAD